MPGLIRLLLLLGVGYLIITGIRRLFLSTASLSQEQSDGSSNSADGVSLVQDPQCGRFIPQSEAIVVSQRGQTVYFCSEKCRTEYRAA